jgi:hypothetical protein
MWIVWIKSSQFLCWCVQLPSCDSEYMPNVLLGCKSEPEFVLPVHLRQAPYAFSEARINWVALNHVVTYVQQHRGCENPFMRAAFSIQ